MITSFLPGRLIGGTLLATALLAPPGALAQSGALDPTFTTGTDGTVLTIVPHGDGKLLIGGTFTTVNGVASRGLARLNADGSVDTTFAVGAGADREVIAMAPTTDGRIYVSGWFTNINSIPRNHFARLRTDGSVDLRFFPQLFDVVSSIIVQSDGKVLIAGDFSSINDIPRTRVARLNADGTLDPTFNAGSGQNQGPDAYVMGMQAQSDGKLIISGLFTKIGNVDRNGIARLNADGSLDSTFNPGLGPDLQIMALAVQPNTGGKILIGGEFQNVNGAVRHYLARLNADGSVDPTFDPAFTIDGPVYSLHAQPDGKVIIGGVFNSISGVPRRGLARLNADSELDLTFQSGAGIAGGLNPNVWAMYPMAADKLLIGGEFTSYNGTPKNRLALINVTGTGTTNTNNPASPRLTGPTHNGSNFQVSVATQAGKNYVLEYKDSLSDVTWNALPAVPGNGATMTLADNAAAGARRFYRVRVQ